MTVATAFLVLLVPVGAWIENEDSIKKNKGSFWDGGFLLILRFFTTFLGTVVPFLLEKGRFED